MQFHFNFNALLTRIQYFFIEFFFEYGKMNEVISVDLFYELVNTLKIKNYKITAAESCTAGLFCSGIAGVPGASDVLSYGFVVYSEEAKRNLLGVSQKTLAEYGVVSEETAKEMVIGAIKKSNADIGVSFTGYAGPGAAQDMLVGRVCFGFMLHDAVFTKTVEFGNIGRNRVREGAAAYAAGQLIKLLEDEV